jgi:hypothetical protein
MVASAVTPSNLPARSVGAKVNAAPAVSMRQARSVSLSSVDVGIATPPTLRSAISTSHSSIVLLSITIARSPRCMPRSSRSQEATWSERAASSP